ncbi:MliC family protein [Bradyrhizobium sp. SYSU BS000235]|uniref:MliC family protein n=1 Tax=Bradyrhizobium sp. SYSU BS000235 TaxID=3411332 RepID=UPI003C72E583
MRILSSHCSRRLTVKLGPVLAAAAIAAMVTSATAHATEASYSCSRGTKLNAQFSAPGVSPGHAVLTFRGSQRRLALPQVMSADGGRYANDKVEFWIRGRDATLTRNGKSETCTSQ